MWRRILVVFSKEVIDNSRDRRSLLVALIYPLLGPILLGLLISAVVGVVAQKTEQNFALAVQGAENAPSLIAFLKQKGIEATPAPTDPKAAVKNGVVEMVVVIPEDFNEHFEAGISLSGGILLKKECRPKWLTLIRIDRKRREFLAFLAIYQQF